MAQQQMVPPDPPPLDPVGPGGPQPGSNLNWAYQQSRYATELAAAQSNPLKPAVAPELMAALYK